jgi:hypothetical protein
MKFCYFCEFKVAAKCTDRNTYLRNRFAKKLPISVVATKYRFFSQKNLFALVLSIQFVSRPHVYSLNGSKVCGVGT